MTLEYILSELEEREREEVFRLKRFKQLKMKTAAKVKDAEKVLPPPEPEIVPPAPIPKKQSTAAQKASKLPLSLKLPPLAMPKQKPKHHYFNTPICNIKKCVDKSICVKPQPIKSCESCHKSICVAGLAEKAPVNSIYSDLSKTPPQMAPNAPCGLVVPPHSKCKICEDDEEPCSSTCIGLAPPIYERAILAPRPECFLEPCISGKIKIKSSDAQIEVPLEINNKTVAIQVSLIYPQETPSILSSRVAQTSCASTCSACPMRTISSKMEMPRTYSSHCQPNMTTCLNSIKSSTGEVLEVIKKSVTIRHIMSKDGTCREEKKIIITAITKASEDKLNSEESITGWSGDGICPLDKKEIHIIKKPTKEGSYSEASTVASSYSNQQWEKRHQSEIDKPGCGYTWTNPKQSNDKTRKSDASSSARDCDFSRKNGPQNAYFVMIKTGKLKSKSEQITNYCQMCGPVVQRYCSTPLLQRSSESFSYVSSSTVNLLQYSNKINNTSNSKPEYPKNPPIYMLSSIGYDRYNCYTNDSYVSSSEDEEIFKDIEYAYESDCDWITSLDSSNAPPSYIAKSPNIFGQVNSTLFVSNLSKSNKDFFYQTTSSEKKYSEHDFINAGYTISFRNTDNVGQQSKESDSAFVMDKTSKITKFSEGELGEGCAISFCGGEKKQKKYNQNRILPTDLTKKYSTNDSTITIDIKGKGQAIAFSNKAIRMSQKQLDKYKLPKPEKKSSSLLSIGRPSKNLILKQCYSPVMSRFSRLMLHKSKKRSTPCISTMHVSCDYSTPQIPSSDEVMFKSAQGNEKCLRNFKYIDMNNAQGRVLVDDKTKTVKSKKVVPNYTMFVTEIIKTSSKTSLRSENGNKKPNLIADRSQSLHVLKLGNTICKHCLKALSEYTPADKGVEVGNCEFCQIKKELQNFGRERENTNSPSSSVETVDFNGQVCIMQKLSQNDDKHKCNVNKQNMTLEEYHSNKEEFITEVIQYDSLGDKFTSCSQDNVQIQKELKPKILTKTKDSILNMLHNIMKIEKQSTFGVNEQVQVKFHEHDSDISLQRYEEELQKSLTLTKEIEKKFELFSDIDKENHISFKPTDGVNENKDGLELEKNIFSNLVPSSDSLSLRQEFEDLKKEVDRVRLLASQFKENNSHQHKHPTFKRDIRENFSIAKTSPDSYECLRRGCSKKKPCNVCKTLHMKTKVRTKVCSTNTDITNEIEEKDREKKDYKRMASNDNINTVDVPRLVYVEDRACGIDTALDENSIPHIEYIEVGTNTKPCNRFDVRSLGNI